jgi:transposase
MGVRGDRVPVFKPYTQSQPSLLPPSLEELVPENHPARVVSSVVDSLDLSVLYSAYEGGGASSYHPSMLLKVVVYSYLRNLYSSRKMEEALGENVHFMWLSGNSRPDHNTLARFRSGPLKKGLREVFTQVVLLLSESGLVSLEESFVDGTKLEASAGRYTFVWGKSIRTNKAKMLARLNELLAYADEVLESEEKTPAVTFEEISPAKVKAVAASLNERLKDQIVPKETRAKLKQVQKEYPERLARYEEQEKILAGRGSYSKTDPDATFMRMKEDPMGNGQLKPGYNLQISTENQFVTHFSVHPNPTDTLTLVPHLEGEREELGALPKNLTADAGYGSEENYAFLESQNVEAYVKHSRFHREQQGKLSRFDSTTWPHDLETDTLTCPAGQTLTRTSTWEGRSPRGYPQTLAIYRAWGCAECPLRKACYQSEEENREVQLNHRLNAYRKKAGELLGSEEGIARRKRRCCEVETVFGQLKANKGFRRLLLRGKEKVHTELGLLLLSHNLAKIAA